MGEGCTLRPDVCLYERVVGLTVREASQGDAAAIAGVHVRAWRVAYRGLLPDDLLDRLSVEDREESWRGILEDAGDESSDLLAAAVSRLREAGWRDVVLWVFGENARACAFYATFGFQPDGSETRHEWAGGQTAIRLRVVWECSISASTSGSLRIANARRCSLIGVLVRLALSSSRISASESPARWAARTVASSRRTSGP